MIPDSLIQQYFETIIDELRQIKKELKTQKPSGDPLNEPAAKVDPDEELRRRAATFECPLCGSPMKLRRRRVDNEPFMGCEDYPDCIGLRDINGKAKTSLF